MMLALAGAVPVEALSGSDPDVGVPDAGIAAHYGDPLREQRLLAEAAAVVDRSNRGILAITGSDRLGFLHSLTTQHVDRLQPLTGTELLVLSPHGHVEHHAVVVDDGATTWLEVEPGTAGALLDLLVRMRFLLRVEPSDVSADWAVLSLMGPQVVGVLEQHLGVRPLAPPTVANPPGPKFAAGAVPAGPTSGYDVAALADGGFARRMAYGVDLMVPRAELTRVVAALDVAPAGIWAFEALRVAARRPRLGRETDHRTLPAEVGWLATAVHLEKGCYRGQESVARVHHLGRPPRRLVLLHLDGVTTDELPAAGTPIHTAPGTAVGFVGTAARHFELGPIALALVKRSVPDEAALTVGATVAAIEPYPDA